MNMLKSTIDLSNPYTDWPTVSTPWERLERYAKCQICKLAAAGRPFQKCARNHLLNHTQGGRTRYSGVNSRKRRKRK